MSHLAAFTIDGFDFVHVEPGDVLDRAARGLWTELHNTATQTWRREKYQACEVSEGELVFAITDPAGAIWGTFACYRMRPVGDNPNVVSALAAPMFPEIDCQIPSESFDPDGNLVNGSMIEEARQRERIFWRRTFAVIERLLLTPLISENGDVVAIDHFRFPSESDGDPAQHQWINVREMFDSFCKIEVQFDAETGAAVRTLPAWKVEDPDPSRSVGAFGVD